jgi:uncharacterized membrane protein YgcG
MTMKHLLLAAFVFCALPVGAQNCDAPVFANPASLLTAVQTDSIFKAESQLTNKGADPRVIVDDTVGITPEEYVDKMRRLCPSWQSANGGVKNNLIVFTLFPTRRKMGLFVGNEFGKAINTSAIRSQFMGPAFKDKDWARGMISGINQTAVQIEAFQTSALHPATTVVQKQATDFRGLWMWLDILAFLFAIVMGWFIWDYYRKRHIAVRDAQQRAVQARVDAATRVNTCPNSDGAELFSRLSSSETWNPDTNGLSVEQYDAIVQKYNAVQCDPPKPAQDYPRQIKTTHHDYARRMDPRPPAPPAPPMPPQQVASPVSSTNTTIIDRGGGGSDLLTGVIIGEGLADRPRYDDRPVYRDREPDPEPEPSRSHGWSDSSSSSSFGSSRDDDSSSSFSDSSSSSSFDSGSSGGSDFSGGSSDF